MASAVVNEASGLESSSTNDSVGDTLDKMRLDDIDEGRALVPAVGRGSEM